MTLLSKTLAVAGVLLGYVASTAAALAATITFTHSGTSSGGSLGGVAFGSQHVTITATADTTAIENGGFGYLSLDHLTATISGALIGTLTITAPTRTFLQQSSGIVGFSRAGLGGFDLLNGPTDPSLTSYDLASDFAAVVGSGEFLQWADFFVTDVTTTGGILVFNSEQIQDVTFSASVAAVPLPAGGLLLVGGIAALGALRRNKRRAA